MDDEAPKKRDWATVFLTRLCVIAWLCVILYETVDRSPLVRQICFFFGPWACVIVVLNSLGLLLIRRQGIFLIFLLLILPPTVDFGIVVRNVAIQKKWIKTADGSEKDIKPAESPKSDSQKTDSQ